MADDLLQAPLGSLLSQTLGPPPLSAVQLQEATGGCGGARSVTRNRLGRGGEVAALVGADGPLCPFDPAGSHCHATSPLRRTAPGRVRLLGWARERFALLDNIRRNDLAHCGRATARLAAFRPGPASTALAVTAWRSIIFLDSRLPSPTMQAIVGLAPGGSYRLSVPQVLHARSRRSA
jgi:hypothetical protein